MAFLIGGHGASPAPLVALGMYSGYCGYCGMLMTSMAANLIFFLQLFLT